MSKTLLVDGNNLLKIGFHGVRDFYHNGKHVGGVWHFLNTLRKFLEEHNYNKVVVFWDSKTSSSQRRLIYPKYKLNRKSSETESKEESFVEQKQRVKQYLEEMFVRQLETEQAEADDLIAHYCKISLDEEKTIFSSDRDLTQLISEKVSIYSPSTKKYYKVGDKIKLYDFEVPHYNVKIVKILTGDSSDNIDGIFYLGEKTLVKMFPEVLEQEVNLTYILEKGNELLKEEKLKNTEYIRAKRDYEFASAKILNSSDPATTIPDDVYKQLHFKYDISIAEVNRLIDKRKINEGEFNTNLMPPILDLLEGDTKLSITQSEYINMINYNSTDIKVPKTYKTTNNGVGNIINDGIPNTAFGKVAYDSTTDEIFIFNLNTLWLQRLTADLSSANDYCNFNNASDDTKSNSQLYIKAHNGVVYGVDYVQSELNS